MSDFNKAIQHVLKWEGGYVHDPKDPGGETNFGISKRSFPDIDIKNLTKEEAIAIYKKAFWDKALYEQINDQKIATKLFDASVNMGFKAAIQIVQRILNEFAEELVVDGQLGPRTVEAINNADQEQLLRCYITELTKFYVNLSNKKPALKKFLKGWLNRAGDIS